jgi:hypothetical protein
MPQESEMLDILRLARKKKDIGHNNGESTIIAFSSSETGRFYKALTGYWIAMESLKLAQQCRYRLQSTENETYDRVAAMWCQRLDLQESLDVLEVFDFVYGFLCQHIDGVNLDSFTNWIDEDWRSINEPLDRERAWFLKNIWVALNPADVLELLHFTSLWREHADSREQIWSKAIRRDYLRMRGFFNTSFPGHVLISDVGESPDTWFSTPHLEEACKLQLRKTFKGLPSEAALAWTKYRTTLWQADARGRFGHMSTTKLLEFIISENCRANQACG